MKRVALFGGSFNPPHPGHFEMAKYIYYTLGVNEVWFLFSQNWQKDVSKYASINDRMEMGRILAQQYPDMPFVMSGIQDELGTHITYEVLRELSIRFPENRFIWVMGADNLAIFHTWEHSEDIILNFPVAIVNRQPYTEKALNGPTALKFHFLRVTNYRELSGMDKGWCFLDNQPMDISSSNLLERLRNGDKKFNDEFQAVADYIIQKRLYSLDAC
jgi:nicotinate-nucleotide adenylyltransferase